MDLVRHGAAAGGFRRLLRRAPGAAVLDEGAQALATSGRRVVGVRICAPSGRAKELVWNGRSHFLQVYRSFKSLWDHISKPAGQLDNRLNKAIETFFLVTFNSSNTKVVGTNHYQGSWYYRKPTFFQVHFRVPHFSPPQDSHFSRLDAIRRPPTTRALNLTSLLICIGRLVGSPEICESWS